MGAKITGQKGQAIFEFIIFLPILMMIISILITITAAINGSINQQKITRGYYFYLLKGDSMFPSSRDLAKIEGTSVGMLAIGWAEALEQGSSGTPIAPCYKMSTLLGNGIQENCTDSLQGKNKTNLIRAYTVFGICSALYTRASPGAPSRYTTVAEVPVPIMATCSIQ